MDNENLNGSPQGTGPVDGIPADGTQIVPPVEPADGTQTFIPPESGIEDPVEVDVDQILTEARGMAGIDTPPPPFRDDEYRETFGEGEELEAVFSDEDTAGTPAPEEEEEEVAAQGNEPVKKSRPKMKKGYGFFGIPHLLATGVWLMVILAIGVTLGRVLWVCAADVLAFGKEPKEAVISIHQSDDMEDIAEKLEKAGLIKYPWLFTLYMNLTDNEVELGTLHLTSMIYDYHAIKTALEPKVAVRETVKVMIPEGYTCAQIFELLEKEGVCTVAELEEYAANGDLNDYWFLEDVERGDKYCLEGYLFPDTYQFFKGHDPELVLEKMLDTFDYRFTDIMKAKLEPLNERLAKTLRGRGYTEDYIAEHKITIREVVIIASMIERETSDGPESYNISSVIYNRLTNPSNFPYLNIDATVIYGLGGKIDPETGESIPLTQTDLQTDTPYNTYTRKGLIPGPISNPGRNSLNAALDPNETAYYYYVYDPQAGAHLFATTPEEHDQNVAKVRSQNN